MKKTALLLAAVFSSQAFAAGTPSFAAPSALALPAISLAPLAPLLALAPGVLPTNLPSLAGVDVNGALYINVLQRGAFVSPVPSQGLPFTVTTVGVPIPPALAALKLPGLP